MAKKILFVEDDPLFGETIQEFLEDEGFEVEHHLDSASAIDATYDKNYHLYLFDLNLPTYSGIELLKELKASGDDTPAIFLTSSTESDDLKQAFHEGADGFINKPVDLDELLLRIKALLKRVYGDDTLTYKEFTLDMSQSLLLKGEERLTIKPKTFQLLQLLILNRNKVVTQSQIESALWGMDTPSSLSVIRVYITELKQILGSEAIENIRGVGYRLHD